ncbi:MAG: hypothetical protein ACLQGP_41405 [Isosphaeraceae bacterium]
MPDVHAVMLFDLAPKVAEMFRNDPDVAAISEPAILVEVEGDSCTASILDRSELEEMLLSGTLEEGRSIEEVPQGDGLISVLVLDGDSASHYRVPDPRLSPNQWPWMGEPES